MAALRLGAAVRSLAVSVGLVLLGACGSYRAEIRDYERLFVRYENAAVEVSLRGQWAEEPDGDAVKGSPYSVLVRYVDAEGAVQQAEVTSLALRGRVSGTTVPLPTPPPEALQPIPGDGQFGIGPGRADPIGRPPNRYAAFLLSDLQLAYEPYDVTGVLVLRNDAGSREVRFSGVLVPAPRTERRNRFWEGLMSV